MKEHTCQNISFPSYSQGLSSSLTLSVITASSTNLARNVAVICLTEIRLVSLAKLATVDLRR